MKHFFLLTISFLLISISVFSQGVVISNNSGASPNANAILDLQASNKGLLLPRVALNDISNVAPLAAAIEGMLIYNNAGTAPHGVYMWGGSSWSKLAKNGEAWKLDGNEIAATDFIGTTNAQDLIFKLNNQERIRFTQKGQIEISNTGNSIFIGENAGNADDLSDNRNVFVGTNSGQASTTGSQNVAIGTNALLNNTECNNNIAIGEGALFTQNYAFNSFPNSSNIAIGYQSLYANNPTSESNAIQNIGIGNSTLTENTIGVRNVAVGQSGLQENTTGEANTALGYRNLVNNTTGSHNIGIGDREIAFNI